MKLRIILEGGALCGLFQVGVLKHVKALEERNKVEVEAISGASVGSYLGFCYFADQLDKVADVISEARRQLKAGDKEAATFSALIRDQVDSISDDLFDSIKKDKLLSARTNIVTLKNCVDSEYGSKAELAESLLCSMHVPYITGPKMFYETSGGERYVDGVFPELFRDRQGTDYSILYVTNSVFAYPRRMLTGWKSLGDRVEEGKRDAELFFADGGEVRTKFCSLVEHWNLADYLVLRSKQTFVWCMRTWMFIVSYLITGIIVPLRAAARTMTDDLMLHIAFGDFYGGTMLSDAVAGIAAAIIFVFMGTMDMISELLS